MEKKIPVIFFLTLLLPVCEVSRNDKCDAFVCIHEPFVNLKTGTLVRCQVFSQVAAPPGSYLQSLLVTFQNTLKVPQSISLS